MKNTDFYSGELNTERIKTYTKISDDYNISSGTVRDIFNAGIDFAKTKIEEENLTSLTSYTYLQLTKMIELTRSWTLNNPSGPLPTLLMTWEDNISDEDNLKAMYATLPESKKPSKIMKILMKLKIV